MKNTEMKKSGGGKLQVRMDPGAETVSSFLPLLSHWFLHCWPSHSSFGKDVYLKQTRLMVYHCMHLNKKEFLFPYKFLARSFIGSRWPSMLMYQLSSQLDQCSDWPYFTNFIALPGP